MINVDFFEVGGRPWVFGPGQEPHWDFGWIPFERRSPEAQAQSFIFDGGLEPFRIKGHWQLEQRRYPLWKAGVQVTGKFLPYNWQVTGSCFPVGTPVRMADGNEKPVEDVAEGDEVISHTGEHRRVIASMRRRFTGDMITLHVSGFAFPLTMTADHHVAVVRGNAGWRWQADRIEWVRADDIGEGDRVLIGWDSRETENTFLDVADLLGKGAVVLDDLMNDRRRTENQSREATPFVNPGMARRIVRQSGIDWKGRVKLVKSRSGNAVLRRVPVGPSLARLIGLYLAEGGVHAGRVVFSFDGRDEEPLAAEVLALVRGLFGVEGEIVKNRPTVITVRFNNQTLAAVFKALMPGDVYTKRVPGIFMGADEGTKTSLVQSWMHGDGHAAFRRNCVKKSARMQGVTVSPDLARDMTTVALSCGMKVSCSRRKARGRSREAFDVYLSGPKALSMFTALKAETKAAGVRVTCTDACRTRFGYARPVKRIEREAVENLPVFDFEVEEDHSFLAGGLVVHNCVGAGGGNMTKTQQCVEILMGDPEEYKEVFWPFAYGRSRLRSGSRSPGEGSSGSAWAEAALKDGMFGIHEATDLPATRMVEGWIQYTERQELSWSDGDAPQSMDKLELAKKHLFGAAARMRSKDDCIAALANGYCITQASNFGFRTSKVRGTPPIRIAPWDGSWSHQTGSDEFWDHPTEGEVFRWFNNWGPGAHGPPTGDEPPGGVYIMAATMDSICRKGEVYAFSGLKGFEARTLPWMFG